VDDFLIRFECLAYNYYSFVLSHFRSHTSGCVKKIFTATMTMFCGSSGYSNDFVNFFSWSTLQGISENIIAKT